MYRHNNCDDKKNILSKKNAFNPKYSVIGDFDLFTKLAKKINIWLFKHHWLLIEIHGDNLSLKNRIKEIDELKHWLRNNKYELQSFEKKIIQNKIDLRKFLYLKLKGQFIESFKLFLNKPFLNKKLKNFYFTINTFSIA